MSTFLLPSRVHHSFPLRCHTTEAALEEAVPLLESAEVTYASIQMFAAECDVLYLLSVVLHNLGNKVRRDAMARKHEVAMEMRELFHLEVVEPWIEDVWAIVSDVGAAIASR